MAYSSRLRKAIGAVRAALADIGLERQSPQFSQHGEHKPLPDAPLVLVACSGGRDSMALAAVAQIVCASLGLRCGAVIVDHQLQDGSGAVAERAAADCRNLGLDPVLVRRADVRDSGKGVEAAAREARYRELCAVSCDAHAACVLLAHTMDDQAETVLLGLLRGYGLDMVAGMPATTVREQVLFVRPLLDLTRDETTGICEEDLHLAYWDDPTNGDSAEGPLPGNYPLRSRIRHDLLPAIEQFTGSDVIRHLAGNARLIQADKAYLDSQAERIAACSVTIIGENDSDRGVIVAIDARTLGREPRAMRLRAVAHALNQASVEASAIQIEAIDQLMVNWHGQSAVNLPRGYSANRKKHVIRVCQDRAHANR
ncbi:tRNA lysidine(34) synthetase TilS [Bifidobacterium felsineum]|uniref:tRNA lysidine(34) synthetase TilS n=1 Tax=Bifidobacterium felsineum TaxID=2045440 RepID=UPI001BDD6B29|nr:tRNA lysidine(34) synthetase TilS [Bifidobacterium felsineum]MBT1163289.1 tRNA lysidine(34) synthetase TilS [Bifidobacterium felsineum]